MHTDGLSFRVVKSPTQTIAGGILVQNEYEAKKGCFEKPNSWKSKKTGATLTLAVNKVLDSGRLTPLSNDTAVLLKVITCNQRDCRA